MSAYVRLTAAVKPQREVLGGKGAGLARLLQLGLPVPEAWVLPAVAVPAGETDLSPALDAALDALWREVTAACPGARFAVRSSAVAEDAADASFAGLYQTVLGVDSFVALREAVRVCHLAVHNAAAQSYVAAPGIASAEQTAPDARMALVVQRLVEAETAGVLFTANPHDPFEDEWVVEAARGLGENVVSGKVQPDQYVLRGKDGSIVRQALGDAGAGPCLTAARVAQLAKLGAAVTARLGPRQDLEWAFAGDALYALQLRPMTGLPPARPAKVYSRRFGDEYIADYSLPLAYDVLMPWISETFLMDFARHLGFAESVPEGPTLRYQGYSYVSGDFIVKLMSAMPRSQRKLDSIPWFPQLWNERILSEPFRPLYLARMMLMVARDPYSSPKKNPAALAEHCADVERTLRPRLGQDYAALDDAAWRAQFAEAMGLGERHFLIIRWGMGFHGPLLHTQLREKLTAWLGDDGEIYQALIGGLPDTKTAETNRRVWDLAVALRKAPVLHALLREGVRLPYVREATPHEPFWSFFDRFMHDYGHRGSSRDIASPRWVETPDVVLGLVRAQAAEGAIDPVQAEGAAVIRREEAEANALQRVTGARRAVLARLIKWTQNATLYRENQRFYLDFILLHIRKLALEQGRRLAAAGRLNEADDIFYLYKGEFEASVGGQYEGDLRPQVAERRRHHATWKDRLPATFLFDGVETEGPLEHAATDEPLEPGTLAGMPVSAGFARGPARVVWTQAELAEVKPGEILVANNTDPGWTPVFPILAGLVTGTGGALSHGALLAREYGIPAVTGIPGVMQSIRTGEVLEIDGRKGRVRKVEG